VVALLTFAPIIGCGGPSASTLPERRLTGEAALEERDEEAPRVRIEGLELPELPATVDADDPQLEPLVRAAQSLLASPAPVPDDALTLDGMGTFIETRWTPWLTESGRSVVTLWQAMQGVNSSELSTHIVARGVTGSALLELARRMANVPLPASVRADANARLAMREAFVRTAHPILDRATQALGACASGAVGAADPTIEDWRTFCDAQLDVARELPRPREERTTPGVSAPSAATAGAN
jgi:hypothetical protein